MDAARFFGAGMDVDKALRYERVAGGRDVAETGAQGDDEIGIAKDAGEIRGHTEAQVANVGRVAVIEEVLTPEGCRDGQSVGLGETLQGRRGMTGPAGATDDYEGTPGAREFGTKRVEVIRARSGLHRLVACGIANCARF